MPDTATRWLLVLGLLAVGGLAAAGCSGSDDEPDTAGTAPETSAPAGAADEYTVFVDNPGPGAPGDADDFFPATYNSFFPDHLTVPAGASIDFDMPWYSGEPHNVAAGTVVDGAVAAYDAVPEGEIVIPGLPLPGVDPELAAQAARLPAALPPNMESTAQAMAKLAPCFLADGDPPIDAACPEDQRDIDQAFDGTQSYVASHAFIADGDTFRLQLADDISSGTYHVICTLHPTSMTARIDVVESADEAQRPDEVAAAAEEQVAAVDAEFAPIARDLADQTGEPQEPSGLAVDAGALGGGLVPVESINVFPASIRIPAGDRVRWNIVGAHMLTFAPPSSMELFRTLERGPDGLARPTEDDLETPGPGQPGMPAGFPTSPVDVDGGSFDGSSYLHSGLLFGQLGPLPPTTYELRFGEPGAYSYYCMRHPGMVGTVVVEP